MENNKSDLTNPLSVEEKARAEDLSGLYPVFEEFGNGVDIQPLDDVVTEEVIPFEDNTGYEEAEAEADEDSEEEKPQKRRRGFGILRVIIAAALMCAVAFAGYNIFLKYNDYSHPAEAVYQKGGKAQVLLDNGKGFEIENVVEAKLSDDGNYLVYSQNSSTKTGKLDIRMVELKKRTSVINKGTLAVSGADEGWTVSADCAYVYYTVTEEGKKHYYAYVTAEKDNQPVVFDAADVFLPPGGDIVFFTRESDQGTQLFRMRIGEKATAVCYVDGIKAFSDDEALEIFYTVKNVTDIQNQTYSLYRITGDAEPLEIAADVSEVYLDDYQTGGNLYYFVKSASGFNWSDFIADDYAESDAAMKAPVRDDYTKTVGFIFKRKKFDESAYNLAMEKYNRKVLRDSIRTALDNVNMGIAFASEYKIKVFDGEKSKELTGGVKLENLLAFSKTGAPKIIIRKSGAAPAEKISMDTLYETAGKNGVDLAVDYAIQTIRSSGYQTNYGCRYLCYNGSNVYEYDFAPAYDTSGATFLFGGKNSVFAAVRTDNIHYNMFWYTVDGDKLTGEKLIAGGVTSFEMNGGSVYVTVASAGINNDLYVCNPDGSTALICENTVKYFINDGTVTALRAKEDESVIRDVELLVFKDGKASEIDGGVYYKNIIVKNNKIAYIKNYENQNGDDAFYGGNMIIYEASKKTETDGSVSAVYDIR